MEGSVPAGGRGWGVGVGGLSTYFSVGGYGPALATLTLA